ncbi:SDR family oxidoreductase [Amorphus sp. 3PC139-8]|uniref:SDR family oxidoreductase n=1 Tax=Amorphus sp. 3PC139-8 TaxID=2735676 RepID=UPI00345DADD6
MSEAMPRPGRKNPLARTRTPTAPQGTRSRTADHLLAAAAEGRFALQVCDACGQVAYPPRDACPACLSGGFTVRDVDPAGTLLAETTIRLPSDVHFRERAPWRTGIVELDAGPIVVAHLHGDLAEGGQTRLALMIDRSGAPVMAALPAKETPNMADDPMLRELTCDPKYRRALVTDGRHPIGQAVAKALAAAGADIVFVGIPSPWKPFPGEEALRTIAGVEIVPLDVTDSESVEEWAKQDGQRVDILVNTAEHIRPGGMVDRHGVTVAREELEVRYLGLMRLAQAFGPVMRARGADGARSATAFVSILSVYALTNWPAYGATSAVDAACLSATQSLRAELAPGGIRVMNVFTGPTDTEWYQTVPPPKVSPAALARALVDGLKRGLEDVYVGDVAADIRDRFRDDPKALERELGR